MTLAMLLSAGCGPSRLEIDNEQGRLDQAAPVIQATATVGQTFVAHRDRLAAVEVLLVTYGETGAPDGELTFHLRADLSSREDLVAQTFRTGDLAHNQPLRVSFEPLPDSAGRRYYFFFEGSAGSQVTVWHNAIDVYGEGRAIFDDQPQVGDLQFKTFYDYSLDMVAGDLRRGLARYGWLAVPLAALLLVPGYLALLVAVPAEELPEPMGQVALAVGLSVALVPLGLLLATLAGVRMTPALLGGSLAVALAGVVWRLRQLGWRPLAEWGQRGQWPGLGLFVVLLVVTLAVRMVQVRELVVPAWVDGVHHTMITQVVLEAAGVPADYGGYLDIGGFIYHFGFHGLAAGLSWLTGLAAPPAVLLMGQVLNGLVGVGVYGLTVALLGERGGQGQGAAARQRASSPARMAGLAAMGLVGTVSLMPAYYVTWGRYTQLTGLVVLPAAVMFTLAWVERGRRWGLLLGGIAVAGLGLVHYRVLVLYGALVLGLVAYRLLGRGPAREVLVRVGMLAGLALLLLSPWLVRLWIVLVPTGRVAGWLSGPASFNAVPRALIDVGYDRILLRLALLSWLLGILWWRRVSILLGLWMAGAVLAANPNLLGGRETWLFNNSALVITLFLPVTILTGVLAGTAVDAILRRIAGRWRPAVLAIAGCALLAIVLVGAWQSLDVVNPVTVIATRDDMAAMEWIRHNTAPDAGFVTNVRLWQYRAYMGADGGYWIPLLTGRRTLVPPALYSFGSREARSRAQAVLDSLAGISVATDQRLADLMARHDLEYVYLGAKGGQLDLKSFIDDPGFQAVYSNGPVWIFRVHRPEAGASR